MAGRILRDFFIAFGLLALWLSTSRKAMEYISDHRDGVAWWCTYPCRHGDLVSLCYLDFVPAFRSGPAVPLKRAVYNGTANTVLVMHGDSYTWHVADTNFAGVCAMYYINRSNGGYYRFDSGKRNILVIEVSERYLRSYFESTQIFGEMHDTVSRKKTAACVNIPRCEASLFAGAGIDVFFNKYINQNLQCNLFNYNFIMPMFESKAALNYYLFNRASGDVVISKDRKRLFLRETVTKTDNTSSYAPVGNEEVNHIVDILNQIYDHYKALGFQEVYFSIIPNPATIMEPDGYNNLIPMVQNNPALRMKIIDVYAIFKSSQQVYYLPGDTHWNQAGKQLWIDLVNERLAGRY